MNNEQRKPLVGKCRCCGGSLDVQWQPSIVPGKSGYFLVTCWDKSCTLEGYTLVDIGYPDMDLTAYLRPRRGMTGKVSEAADNE